jgi:hypothetical protein
MKGLTIKSTWFATGLDVPVKPFFCSSAVLYLQLSAPATLNPIQTKREAERYLVRSRYQSLTCIQNWKIFCEEEYSLRGKNIKKL